MCLLPKNMFCIVYLQFVVVLILYKLIPTKAIPPESVEFKEGNGYFYATISTPNFPLEFETPFKKIWSINTTNITGPDPENALIRVFFTELFIQYPEIQIFDQMRNSRSYNPIIWKAKQKRAGQQYLEVHASIPSMEEHIRTKMHYHDVFGFNISIEVKNLSSVTTLNDNRGCSIRNCSFAGRCKSFPGKEGLEFRCECVEGYFGQFCQWGPECNHNRNFCLNGGTCLMLGLFGGDCTCRPGFSGDKCQHNIRSRNLIENQECSNEVNERPCSLCNSYHFQNGWRRYFLWKVGYNTQKYITNDDLSKIFVKYSTLNRLVDFNIRNYLEVYGIRRTNWSQANIAVIEAKSIKDSENYTLLQPSIAMNKPNTSMLVGQSFSLTCTVNLLPDIPFELVHLKWFKDGVPIHQEYNTIRHIAQFTNTQETGAGGNRQKLCTKRHLQNFKVVGKLFTFHISVFDMGRFSCQVTDLMRNVQECTDYSMQVVVPPQIEVLPMSATVVKGESKIIMCSDGLEAINSGSHASLRIDWFQGTRLIKKNSEFSTEKILPKGKLLRIKNAQRSATFTCRASNDGGVREREIRLEVLQKSAKVNDFCPTTCEMVETAEARLWSLTAIDQNAMIKCPQGFYGYAQKLCFKGKDGKGNWAPTDYSRCTHEKLRSFNYTLRGMFHGYNVRSAGLHVLYSELNKYLDDRKGNMSVDYDKLLLGEGDKFSTILEDIFNYIRSLRHSSPNLVGDEVAVGLVAVVDNFITFRNSCARESSVDSLLQQFFTFVEEFNWEFYRSDRIMMSKSLIFAGDNSTKMLPRVEIDGITSKAVFDCNAITDGVELEGRFFTFIKLSEMHLKENDSFISDIVRVKITNTTSRDSCFKGDAFEIQFHVNETSSKKPTCAALGFDGFPDSGWQLNVCRINASLITVITCYCTFPGTYAILALDEGHPQQLEPGSQKIQFPPEWIAVSGCIVCLVLSTKTLICILLHKLFCPYLIMITAGIIISCLCLFAIFLMFDSRESNLLYLLITLTMQSTRMWRMIWVCDLQEVFEWIEEVSKWTLLVAVTLASLLPFFTVFLCDAIFSENGSILEQNSPVFITFTVLFAASVLSIFILYYNTYLRIHEKSTTNNNRHGDQKTLNETLINTISHTVQVLCFILYFNLKSYIFFHYTLAISTAAVGLVWCTPKKANHTEKRRNNLSDEISSAMNHSNGNAIPIQSFNNVNNLSNRGELKPLRQNQPIPEHLGRCSVSTAEDEDTTERTTIGSSVNSVVKSVSGISHNSGFKYLQPYAGAYPKRAKCHINFSQENENSAK